MALVNFQDISLSFGGPLLLDKVNLQIHDGDKICLLGRNGTGKSSMMKLMQGITEADSGKLIIQKDCITSALPQDVPEQLQGSIFSIVARGLTSSTSNTNDGELSPKLKQEVLKILSRLSLKAEDKFENLSAGLKRRVLLGQALVSSPDLLLLDEPTNHLDIDSIKWLEDFLSRYPGAVFFVSHDRVFLQNIANRIIELDRGKLADWSCDYKTFLIRKEALLKSEEIQNAHFDKKLAKEEAWIRKGIKARRTRNEGRVRALEEMRRQRAKRREQLSNVSMTLHEADRSGKLVVEAKNISFAYSEDNPIVKDFSTVIQRGDKVGIIGPNGCGKSTLVKLLLEGLKASKGSIRLGTRLEIAYFDQLKNQIDDSLSLIENVAEAGEYVEFNGNRKHVISYLQDFLFSPDRLKVKAGILSGGEKNRLMLAKLFARPANLLIFDEPTNDLDLETVELLEALFLDYKGTLILISHDRAFINNVVGSSIVFEGEAKWQEYAGGYDDWLFQKKNAKKDIANTDDVKKSKKKKIASTNSIVNSAKKKLSNKEKQDLENMPSLIEQKENRKEELGLLLASPDTYKEKVADVPKMNEELENLEKELEQLFERWEELELRK